MSQNLFASALLVEVILQSRQIRDVRCANAVIWSQMNFTEFSARNLEGRRVQEVDFVVRQVNVAQVGHRCKNLSVECLDQVVFKIDPLNLDQIIEGVWLDWSDFVAIQVEINEISHVFERIFGDDFKPAVSGVQFRQIRELFTDVLQQVLDLFVSAVVNLFNSRIDFGFDNKVFAVDGFVDGATFDIFVQVNWVNSFESARNFVNSCIQRKLKVKV